MWPLVTYSYHFEIISTVTKEPGTVGVFLFNTVILYHYNQGTCNICSTWFLDIVISTCLSVTFWKETVTCVLTPILIP